MTKSKSISWSVATGILSIAAYIITWRFYAMWWFIIVFFDFGVFLFYLIVTVRSITFWIKNRKTTGRTNVPLGINLIVALIIICSPPITQNKSYPKGSFRLNKNECHNCERNLYVEYYCVYGHGFMTTDIDAIYLTDKKNFRLYIGTCDEGDQAIKIRCSGDSIVVVKTTTEGISIKWTNPLVLERKSFSLAELINDHSFQ